MATKKPNLIANIVKELETTAKRIRADVRKLNKDAKIGSNLERLARDLRKGAAHVGDQIDRYVREVRNEVEASAKKAVGKRGARKRTTKKRGAKKRVAKKRAAKKTARRRK